MSANNICAPFMTLYLYQNGAKYSYNIASFMEE